MASGLVVVAFNYAAARTHIAHGETGVLVRNGNLRAFIEAARSGPSPREMWLNVELKLVSLEQKVVAQCVD